MRLRKRVKMHTSSLLKGGTGQGCELVKTVIVRVVWVALFTGKPNYEKRTKQNLPPLPCLFLGKRPLDGENLMGDTHSLSY